MPKQVAEDAKRVPLNCLVLPATLEYLKSADGSQGAIIDRAVAALQMQESALDADIAEFEQRRQETRERVARGARAFKGPILRPKDKKK